MSLYCREYRERMGAIGFTTDGFKPVDVVWEERHPEVTFQRLTNPHRR